MTTDILKLIKKTYFLKWDLEAERDHNRLLQDENDTLRIYKQRAEIVIAQQSAELKKVNISYAV